jgi:hypothetical protein
MTDDRFERELRERFGALRAEVERVTPAFGLRPRPAKRRGATVWLAAAAAVVLIVAGRLAFFDDAQSQAYTFDLAGAYWTAPTDFLLNTPGLELLSEVPEIDVNGLVPVPSPPGPETTDTVLEPRRSQS